MATRIEIDEPQKLSHVSYIGWLNRLLENYIEGFWDDAVKSSLLLTLVRTQNVFIQELYQGDGKELSGFITITPSDNSNAIIMVHTSGNGEPYLYNKQDLTDIIEMDNDGVIIRFFENVIIDLHNSSGVATHDCHIFFSDLYGMKCPMIVVSEKLTYNVLGIGIIDMLFKGRYSGSYSVETKPLNAISYFEVTNVSKAKIVADIPIVTNKTVRYEIDSGNMVRVPYTEWSEYYFRQAKDTGVLKTKLIEV